MDESITDTELDEDEVLFEATLRPNKFDDYIGQEKTKRNLEIFIEAARMRGDALDHVLFYGPPGLGKTTLANIIASEMCANIKSTSGPVIEKSGDLAAILTNLKKLFLHIKKPGMNYTGLFLYHFNAVIILSASFF